MQKLDFIKKIEIITERLKSTEIVRIFQEGFSKPTTGYNYGFLNPLLFTSKSQFDQMMLDPKLEPFLSLISGKNIYDEEVISTLPNVFKPNTANNIIYDSNATNFFSFHKGLIDTLNISKELLSNEIINNNNSENLENGVLLLTVQIESEGLNTQQYIKIFTLLTELINTIGRIYEFEDYESEIVLLDSGSNTNLGIKTKVELAKSIFEIFKEVWDFITSFKYIRNEQKSNALLESLSVRKQILKSVEEGVISEEEGKEYSYIIKTRIDNLIGLKVLPRELIIESQLIESKKLLNEYKTFLLENRKD